jgi:glutamate-ammonia-ligase adenylyltransferase
MASNDRSDEQWFDLKLGRGGIVDIEFIVQYCVLRWAHNHPELTAPRSNVVLLETLGSSGVLESAKATALKMIYSELLAMEQRLKLQELPPMVEQQLFVTERQQVIGLWDELLLKR